MLSRPGINRRQALAGSISALGELVASPALAENQPIRVGMIASLTGAFATNAQAVNIGFQCGIDDLNAQGGLLGRKLSVVTRDSAADPSKAVNFIKELLFNDRVDVICGPTNSGEVLPTLGITASAKIIQIVSGSVDELIDPKKYPLAFRCLSAASQWYNVSIKYNVETQKRTKIALITDNSSYGIFARQHIVQLLSKYNIKPVYAVSADIGKPDMTDDILKARSAGADSIELWSNSSGFLARTINARGEQQWNVPIYAQPSAIQGQVVQLLRKKEFMAHVYCAGYRNSVLDDQGKLPAATQNFLDRHKAKIAPYMDAGIYAILQGYNIPFIYAAGVRKCGSLDSAAVAKALENVGTITLPYGPFHYTAADHTGFPDSGLTMVAADSLQPNGGFKPANA